MFRSLSLSHFMKYEAASFEFLAGINVVRGASEAGKSTMLRGLLYALGGVRATGLSADDLVRWGSRPAQMKVEMTIENDGVTYLIKRAPSGAEVWFSGRDEPDVVGQTEVSEFCMRLIGTDLDGLKSLMFANQNSMRGALESGPAATIALIEQLAELGQVDDLIQLVGEKLPSGATTGVEARIATMEGQAADLRAKTYDHAAAAENLRAAEEDVVKAEAEAPALQATLDAAAQKLTTLQALAGSVRIHNDNVTRATRELASMRQNLAAAEHSAGVEVLGDPEKLRADIAALESLETRRQAHSAVASYLELPEQFWEGSEASLKAEMSSLRESVNKDTAQLADYDKRVALAKARMISSSKCTYCGKDVSELAEVKKTNDECMEELELCGKAAAVLLDQLAGAKTTLKVYEGLIEQNSSRLRLASKYAGFVEVLDTTVPATLRWAGEVPGASTQDAGKLRAELRAVEASLSNIAAAKARLPDLQRSVQAAEARLAELQAQPVEAITDEAVAEAEATKTCAKRAVDEATRVLTVLRRQVAAATAEVQKLQSAEAADKQWAALLEEQIRAAEAEKAEIEENNQLVKDLRRVRPIVAEQVWNMVLAAVSTYFTEMRGEDSVVTRSGREFLVNGKAIAGLSGSTKDILGLAIRMALTKTFLPQTRFLVLDEPWAACDSSRSERCLGFLQGSGFDQVLLVTHESSSEAVADSLIQL